MGWRSTHRNKSQDVTPAKAGVTGSAIFISLGGPQAHVHSEEHVAADSAHEQRESSGSTLLPTAELRDGAARARCLRCTTAGVLW